MNMKKCSPAVFGLIILAACSPDQAVDQTTEPASLISQTDMPLGWLSGCWQTEDGTVTERWTAEENGYLFGSALTEKDGQIVFFEQMRIEPGSSGSVFNAYPRGQGPSAFPAIKQDEHSITFANAEHDYPQKITYTREGDHLTGIIALMDGSNSNQWDYIKCKSEPKPGSRD